MPLNHLYQQYQVQKQANQKLFAVLLDPDNLNQNSCETIIRLSEENKVDLFLMGGSLITNTNQAELLAYIKSRTAIPVILFPSSSQHIDPQADGILLLSLISGRNPDLLIGQHVISAPLLKASGITIYPTGYMLVDTGRQTTASYMSGTTPLPYDKPAIAACTALAGEQLGLRYIYIDGGSGALKPISKEMVEAVRAAITVPLIVGGGINSAAKAKTALEAGADVIVIGNEIEKNPGFIAEVSSVIQSFKPALA